MVLATGVPPASGNDVKLSTHTLPESKLGAAPTPVLITLQIPSASSPSNGNLIPALAAKPQTDTPVSADPQVVLLPTATPALALSPTPDQELNLPKAEILPAIGVKFTPTPTSTPLPPTPAPTDTSTPYPLSATVGQLWSTFVPLPAEQIDHFWISNPFEDITANRVASPNYQFGSTAGNRYRIHHGMDISNPIGTPIEAGTVGTVVHAGPDDVELLGPYNNFYGKAVVIRLDRRLPVAGGELDVYVLYGHMSEVRTTVGAHVEPKDIIGLVGMTGIAIGPHLHVEMRLGANDYQHSVNPYLWVQPAPGTGAVAVRILTADGRTWAAARVTIAHFEGSTATWARQIDTYLDSENIGPDPVWGENGAMGDVPPGFYYLIGNIDGESIRSGFTVTADHTTFLEVRTRQ